MNSYAASNELIDIITANGFVEDTAKNYPEHAERLKKQLYDPHHMKRHFVFKGTHEKLYFDYIHIILPSGNGLSELTIDDLKSLIAFCRLSATDRTALREERYHPLSIPAIVKDVNRAPRIYSKSVYKRAVKEFEALSYLN